MTRGIRAQPPNPIVADALIREAEWQKVVTDLFELHGWRLWHNVVAWRSNPGWPDLVCVHQVHGIIFVELKTRTGKVTPEQESWHASLRAAGQFVTVLRPADWEMTMRIAKGMVSAPGMSSDAKRLVNRR